MCDKDKEENSSVCYCGTCDGKAISSEQQNHESPVQALTENDSAMCGKDKRENSSALLSTVLVTCDGKAVSSKQQDHEPTVQALTENDDDDNDRVNSSYLESWPDQEETLLSPLLKASTQADDNEEDNTDPDTTQLMVTHLPKLSAVLLSDWCLVLADDELRVAGQTHVGILPELTASGPIVTWSKSGRLVVDGEGNKYELLGPVSFSAFSMFKDKKSRYFGTEDAMALPGRFLYLFKNGFPKGWFGQAHRRMFSPLDMNASTQTDQVCGNRTPGETDSIELRHVNRSCQTVLLTSATMQINDKHVSESSDDDSPVLVTRVNQSCQTSAGREQRVLPSGRSIKMVSESSDDDSPVLVTRVNQSCQTSVRRRVYQSRQTPARREQQQELPSGRRSSLQLKERRVRWTDDSSEEEEEENWQPPQRRKLQPKDPVAQFTDESNPSDEKAVVPQVHDLLRRISRMSTPRDKPLVRVKRRVISPPESSNASLSNEEAVGEETANENSPPRDDPGDPLVLSTMDGKRVDLRSLPRTRCGRVVKPILDYWRGQKVEVDENDTILIRHGSQPKRKYMGSLEDGKVVPNNDCSLDLLQNTKPGAPLQKKSKKRGRKRGTKL